MMYNGLSEGTSEGSFTVIDDGREYVFENNPFPDYLPAGSS